MSFGIYQNKKNSNLYKAMAIATYVHVERFNEKEFNEVAPAIDCTNERDGKECTIFVPSIEFPITNYHIVGDFKEINNQRCMLYHNENEFPIKNYFVRDTTEFFLKFSYLCQQEGSEKPIVVSCPECKREARVFSRQEVFVCTDSEYCGYQCHMDQLYGVIGFYNGQWHMTNTCSM